MSDLVLIQEYENYALLTLNIEAKRNPISPALRSALVNAMETQKARKNVASIVITGAGKAFCSGMDLEDLAKTSSLTREAHLADSHSLREFFEYVYAYPKPTIAAVNGPAVAGGCGLALVCDITVASEKASFCFSEVKIGFVPAIVSVYLQKMAGPKVARDLLLTARVLSPAEAMALRIINSVVPPDQLLSEAAKLANLLAANSPSAVQKTKGLLLSQEKCNSSDALDLAEKVNAEARGGVDCKEGVEAFFEKRLPKWQ